jgi:glucose/arabinose dehydrogenase
MIIMRKYLFTSLLISFPLFAKTLPVEQLTLPDGFHIGVLANSIENPREMALGNNGIIFVGTTNDKVYALIPNKNNKNTYTTQKILSGLNQPQGVAFYKDYLYVAEINRVLRYKIAEKNLDTLPAPEIIAHLFPYQQKSQDGQSVKHAWKTIHFGPDNKLYIPIGMPCDSCLSNNKFAGTLIRMTSEGKDIEIYAKGLRNSVGFDWDSAKKLWFTDNGRDYLGDDFPPDKLYCAPEKGLDFGFPYYLGIDDKGAPIPDPKYGKLKTSQGITWEKFNLPAHVAVLNMVFYTGDMFPKKYKNQIFIAEHGSWNRSKKVGYRVTLVELKNNQVISYTPFITGWKKNQHFWGRPVGLLIMPDGSLLISDDYANAIYRVTYENHMHS